MFLLYIWQLEIFRLQLLTKHAMKQLFEKIFLQYLNICLLSIDWLTLLLGQLNTTWRVWQLFLCSYTPTPPNPHPHPHTHTTTGICWLAGMDDPCPSSAEPNMCISLPIYEVLTYTASREWTLPASCQMTRRDMWSQCVCFVGWRCSLWIWFGRISEGRAREQTHGKTREERSWLKLVFLLFI